jgi:enoyl-CoA hydratase/carnithine racemase
MTTSLITDIGDHVLTITLNRPGRRNAFTPDMLAAWAAAVRMAQRDQAVRVVVVKGAGHAFCSGVDLDAFESIDATPLARRRFMTDVVHPVARAVQDLDKPLIACVEGPAYGAGLDMALMCDLRVAGRSAKLAASYVNIGLVPGDGGAWLLPRLVGSAKALELLWTGDAVSADKALAFGLVNHVYDDQDVEYEALSLARKIAAKSPVAVRLIKQSVRQFATVDFETSLEIVASHLAVIQSTSDHAEALAATRQHRTATFADS